MRWRQAIISTSREAPKEAATPSHALLVRGGYARQVAPGIFTYLPLGWRVIRRIMRVCREELDRAGSVELRMPMLAPLSLWQETGRDDEFGPMLLRIAGGDNDWRSNLVLGPTHEELVTDLARTFIQSYKQLPLNVFQVQTKFRGEPRVRAGLMRTREFIMKDAYSFHADHASLEQEYDRMLETYRRIFARVGLDPTVVQAEPGAMGGEASHEFMVFTDAGEDIVAVSDDGSYAANVQRACAKPPNPAPDGPLDPLNAVHTPQATRVEGVCRLLGVTPACMIKTMIFSPELPIGWSSRRPRKRIVALIRGDHEVNVHKLARASGVTMELADADTVAELTGAAVGFSGPVGLSDRADRIIIDPEVVVMRNAVAGANRTDYHYVGVNPGRDFPLDHAKCTIADIRNVTTADHAPTPPHGRLTLRRAIEVGGLFKLGERYSRPMSAAFVDRDGRTRTLQMGCYGIGLNRLLAAVVEMHHDEAGPLWPANIAPFDVILIVIEPQHEHVATAAERLYDQLRAAQIDVLLDDRHERAGHKFHDADLIGAPLRIVVGDQSLADGGVQIDRRRRGDSARELLPLDSAAEHVIAAVRAAQT